jgi:hypothetical protein
LNVIEDEGMGKSWGIRVPRPSITYSLEKAEADWRRLRGE